VVINSTSGRLDKNAAAATTTAAQRCFFQHDALPLARRAPQTIVAHYVVQAPTHQGDMR